MYVIHIHMVYIHMCMCVCVYVNQVYIYLCITEWVFRVVNAESRCKLIGSHGVVNRVAAITMTPKSISCGAAKM